MDNRIAALISYLQRKSRAEHPDGRTDNAGRWFPKDSECCPECTSVRQPTRSYPWSLMLHCRSLKHICASRGIDEQEVRDLMKKKNLPLLISSGNPWLEAFVETKLKAPKNKATKSI